MASAAHTQTIGSGSETAIFTAADDGGNCTTFMVRCQAGSANGVLVNVPGLHEASADVLVPPGEKEYFRKDSNGIDSVLAEGNTGNAICDFCVVAKIS